MAKKLPKVRAWFDQLEPDLLELVDMAVIQHYVEAVAADFAAVAVGGRADVQGALRRHLLPPLWRFVEASGDRPTSGTAAASALELAVMAVCEALDRQRPARGADQLTSALRTAWVGFAAALAAPRLYADLPKERQAAADRSKDLSEAAKRGNQERAKLPAREALQAEFRELCSKGFEPLAAKHKLEKKYGVTRQGLNWKLKDAD